MPKKQTPKEGQNSRRKSATKKSTLPKTIPPEDYLSVLWDHLTPELCREVFEITRDKERERKWTLFALMKVWMGLLQNPVLTQTQAIEACGQGHPMFPLVEASSESFFMRMQSLRPEFFRNIFTGFTKSIEDKLPANFQSELAVSVEDFPEIYAVDGNSKSEDGANTGLSPIIFSTLLIAE